MTAPNDGTGTEGAGEAEQDHGPATEARIAEVMHVCRRYGTSSIIALAGVPGTGKSHVGRIAAQRLAGEPTRVREIQFHPSTTYEEFVEGMRIDATGAITVFPGLFLEWNEYALDNSALTWVVLIDELTRANLSAVLGELMTFVEDRGRSFTTVYRRRPVKVATNLILLATYNPTDRSALEVDNALLRRLRVMQFDPDIQQLHEMLGASSLSDAAKDQLAEVFIQTRAAHPDDYAYQMPFGHGIFAEVLYEVPDLHQLWVERLSHMLRRPLVQPHPFYDTIRRAYPWVDPAYRTT